MRERDVEKHLVTRVKQAGGEIRKVEWIGRAHAPDRLVMLGGAFFVELKAPGKKPNAGQLREHTRMAECGVRVLTIDSVEKVDVFVDLLEEKK
jgi:hypothetical protein